MPIVTHFEIPAANPECMIKFYKKLFDWKLGRGKAIQCNWLVTIGENKKPGINCAVMDNGNFETAANKLGLSSVDELLEKLRNGKVTQSLSLLQALSLRFSVDQHCWWQRSLASAKSRLAACFLHGFVIFNHSGVLKR